MAKLNKRASVSSTFNPTINAEGGAVHQLNAIETLFSKTLGSFFGEKGFYKDRSAESEYAEVVRLIEEIPDDQIEYALKIASLGRYWNMISFPLAILTACFNDDRFKGRKTVLPQYTDEIVRRAKDINEVLATHFAMHGNGNTLPSQMRKTLRSKLESFDRYKLSTGLDRRSEVKLADAIKVLHPKPKNAEMEKFYRDIIENNVTLGDGKRQVRSVLSDLGKAEGEEQKTQLKDELAKTLHTGSLFTIVRNLVPYVETGILQDTKNVDIIVNRLIDKQEIARSKMLPFRFYSAFRQLQDRPNILPADTRMRLYNALIKAVDLSIENLTPVEGTNCILVDVSGSMVWGRVSSKSTMSYADIALLLGAIVYKKGYGDFYIFATGTAKMDMSNQAPIFDIIRHAKGMDVGGGTDLRYALQLIESAGVSYDNLVILTDSDYQGTPFVADRQLDKLLRTGITKRVWVNNLAGNDYTVANMNHPSKHIVTGFNARFIEMMNLYRQVDRGNILTVIDELLAKERA